MISDESIEEVRARADIVQLIGEHVKLKRSGSDYRGPCPFHQGKNPNFSVSPARGFYHCFVCHESGDVFRFFQRHLGMDWTSSVRMVAERSGVTLIETRNRTAAPDDREPLWEVLTAAAELFRDRLHDEREGRAARAYLESRAFDAETVSRFGIGWAPGDGESSRSHLASMGYDDGRQLQAGLLAQRDDGSLRWRFRNRLMIPISDAAGRIAGFGGRLIADGEPKYLNSPESRVFSKSHLLFNQHAARHSIRKEDRVLVVEGYFDAIRVAAAGIPWVVAPLGTALTEGQADLLRRLTRNVILLYDGDAAGLKATFRAADELLRHNVAVQVVTLPEGEDPDAFVRKKGPSALLAQIGAAIDVFERKIQLLERAGWFSDLKRARAALDRLLPTIRATADPLTRDLYLSRAAEVSHVTRELLEAEADRPERAPLRTAIRSSDSGRERRAQPLVQPRLTRGFGAERGLISVVLRDRSQFDFLVERLDADDFQDARLREIFTALVPSEGTLPMDELAALLSQPAAALLESLVAEANGVVNLAKTVDDCLTVLECRKIRTRSEQIDRLRAVGEGDVDTLLVEKEKLRDRARELGCMRVYWK